MQNSRIIYGAWFTYNTELAIFALWDLTMHLASMQ
jgi:hypothetical protein